MKAAIALVCCVALAGAMWFLTSPRAADHLLISDAVARPLEGGGAVALMTIANTGAPDRLLSVSSAQADAALYAPEGAGGVPVPTGNAALALDGAHITISAAGSALEEGALLPLTLHFKDAGNVSVKARLSTPAKTGHAGHVGLFGMGDICIVGEGEPAPQITIAAVPEGAGWRVSVTTEEFEFSKDLMGAYHVPGMGHGHIYVGGMKLGRLFEPTYLVGPLPRGEHVVRVTLNTNDHRAYVVENTPVTAEAVILVD